MDQLPAQISSACAVALSADPAVPQEQRHQAYAYLQSVKEASAETWQACWKLFLDGRDEGQLAGKGSTREARMFAVQVVGEASVPDSRLSRSGSICFTHAASSQNSHGGFCRRGPGGKRADGGGHLDPSPPGGARRAVQTLGLAGDSVKDRPRGVLNPLDGVGNDDAGLAELERVGPLSRSRGQNQGVRRCTNSCPPPSQQ